ncbi:helix-turn-helix transcriptional regulator [Homoserinibacter sp. GY 40078]|uniref:helix-turn-helix transcriptional regulator n=1 Tax=Homoserinibacter sp. GY 40078 TaxID=2603275 RepID=UPI00164F9247|nr:helix-turn-helix transcriptional regulator [Homoserinibacter sp. GY 40078]
MDHVNPLAQFLRARRALVEPEQIGLPRGSSPRRVAGLRREEVALVAGISSDYYLKLEQGRELHPSAAVLDGVARALALDADGVAHLHRLARPPIVPIAAADEVVSPSLIGLLTSLPSVPAHITTRYLDILYVNRLAEVLTPGFRVGNNLVKLMFNPQVPRDAYWWVTARRAVAFLRATVDPYDDGPRMTALLADLHEMAPEFDELWERHESRMPGGHPSTFSHAEVGLIELRHQTFQLPGTGGQVLGMYIPAPGGPSAEKLQMLSVIAAEADRVTPRKSRDTTTL